MDFGSILPLVGAGAGFALGGPVGAGIGALAGGALGSAIENSNAADAQQAIAQAQLEQQRRTQQQALSYAKPTDDELKAMQGQLQLYQRISALNEENLKQQTALAQAINPNIIEAAKQAYSLMTGGTSASTTGVMAQRAQQRRALEDSLASKLGSGYATSTAGMQALNQFDNQSQQLQFGMMGSLLQYSGQFNPNMGAQIAQSGSSTSGTLLNYSNTANAISGREISALESTNITPYAGANNVSALSQGQFGQAMSGQIMGAGLGMLGSYAGSQFAGQAYNQYGGGVMGAGSAMQSNPYATPNYFNQPGWTSQQAGPHL